MNSGQRDAPSNGVDWEDAQSVASHGRRLRRAVGERGGERGARTYTVHLRVSFMASFLADMLVACLERARLRVVVHMEVTGSLLASVAEPAAPPPDVIVAIATPGDVLRAPRLGCSSAEADEAVRAEVAPWCRAWAGLRAPCVQTTFPPPPLRPLDEADGFVPGGALRHTREVNREMARSAPVGVALVDAEALVQRVGAGFYAPRTEALCGQPFSMMAALELARALAASIVGVLGRARKVLVVDLDNTIWGGVVADVGPHDVLSASDPNRAGYLRFQRYLIALAERGVLLAVCSKNDEQTAREPFRVNEAMLLRESHVASFVANFNSKVENLRAIARALNVGTDALVFVDDSRYEREVVRRALPDVLVPESPACPHELAAAIDALRGFPTSRPTAEDLMRSSSYRGRAEVLLRTSGPTHDAESFLVELESRLVRVPLDERSCERASQLLRKTNQFNMTGRCFSPAELLERAASVVVLQLVDRLEDYGITTVVVTHLAERELVVDNWVMSCRTMMRRVEDATLEVLRAIAARAGAIKIVVRFQATERNASAAASLVRLGLARAESGCFVGEVASERPPRLVVSIRGIVGKEASNEV